MFPWYSLREKDNSLLPSVYFRHAALLRNQRCVLAYLYHRIKRLRQMRWELGSILPPEITANLLKAEEEWFQNYNKSLATYMRSIGDDHGLNLTVNMCPPKTLYVEVWISRNVKRKDVKQNKKDQMIKICFRWNVWAISASWSLMMAILLRSRKTRIICYRDPYVSRSSGKAYSSIITRNK